MSFLLVNTLIATGLAVLVLAVGRWGKPAPAVMHALWLFVLLKLVTPPLVSVPIDISWWSAPPATRPFVVPVALDDLGNVPTLAPRALLNAAVGENAAVSLAAPSLLSAVPPVFAFTWSWEQVLLATWLAGSIVMACWFTIGLWRGHRYLRRLQPVPSWQRREVTALAASLGVHVPDLRDDPNASSPYVWSFGRTRLVLPVAVLAKASDKGRAAVLVHELAHLRRRDHWLAHGELLLAVAMWWHPLFWFARARLRLWAELAADAWAVASVPDATLDYAAVLVQAVAAPDSAVRAPAILAARPAAQSAFETRLTMILNENVPCRASRAWWLPFTSLALGLFAVPVAAQNPNQDPVEVEIRINGKEVDELTTAERKALLRKLLEAEDKPAPKAKASKPGKADKVNKADSVNKAEKASKAKTHRHEHSDHSEHVDVRVHHHDDPLHGHLGELMKLGKLGELGELGELAELGELGEMVDIGEMVRQGLAEARFEILNDEDLRELGISDDVSRLLDDIAAGKGIDGSIDGLIKSAMKGAGKMVEKELRADKDLQELGMTDGILKLVHGFMSNERNQEAMGDMVRRLTEKALDDAKLEVRHDHGLKELGITLDVEKLIDDLMHGGDFDGNLQKVIDKAMKGAWHKAKHGDGHGDGHGDEHESSEADEKPAPAKKKVQKPRADREVLIR